MAIQIQFRRGTATQWASANPVLALAELGIETDTKLFKIGDGATAWNSLDYGGLQGQFIGSTPFAIITSNSTSSTSTTTGALRVAGGAGIQGNVFAGSVYTNSLFYANGSQIVGTRFVTLIQTGTIAYPSTGTVRFYPPANMSLTKVFASLGTAGATNLQFSLLKNGSAINTYTINAGSYLMTPVGVSVSLTTTDYLTLNIIGGQGGDLRVDISYVFN